MEDFTNSQMLGEAVPTAPTVPATSLAERYRAIAATYDQIAATQRETAAKYQSAAEKYGNAAQSWRLVQLSLIGVTFFSTLRYLKKHRR